MKPREYWDSTYREVSIYTQTHLVKIIDDLKREINLQESVTNKLIKADAMINKKPKIELIRDNYKELFEEEKQTISPEEITKRMRFMIKIEKNK